MSLLVACSSPKTGGNRPCTTDSQCNMGEVCSHNFCEQAQICTPNAATCQGNNLMKCSADGTTLTLETACPVMCSAGACTSGSCTPGDQKCDPDGKSIDQCSKDGTTYQPVSVCSLGCDSMTNACKTPVCKPNSSTCTPDGQIQVCNQDGSGTTTMPCGASAGDGGMDSGVLDGGGASAMCVSNGLSGGAGSAWCEQLSCTPGAVRCEGITVVQCNATGTGETQITLCDSSCDSTTGQCATTMCQPGSQKCSADGSSLERCNDLGTGYDTSSCSAMGGMGVCVSVPGATGSQAAYCAMTLCTPGSNWCDGNQVFSCSADGMTESMVETCPFGCSDGMCKAPMCSPGQQECNGDNLMQCAPDQQSFIEAQFCTAGCVSNGPGQAACAQMVCSPFLQRCSADGTSVEVCRADGSGFDTMACGPMEDCMNGSCVAQQPNCVAGTNRCNGPDLQSCEQQCTSEADGGQSCAPLNWTNVGACLGTCTNSACDMAGSCGPFGLSIALATPSANLPGDGQSTFMVLSDPLVGPDGTVTPDGTLITVAVGGDSGALPALLSGDADPNTTGLQVPVINGRIQFLIQAPALSIGTSNAVIRAKLGNHGACSASLPVTFDAAVTDRFVGDDFSTFRERDPAVTTATWDTKKEMVSLAAFDAGDGRDGPLVVAAGQTVDLSTLMSNGHSFPDMASAQVVSIDGAQVTISGSLEPFSQGGTRVLIINLQGPSGQASAVGTYEFATVSGVSGAFLNLTAPVARVYSPTDNTVASLQNQVVQIIRVPQYSSVQVQPTGVLTGPAFNGTSGGVLAFFAQSATGDNQIGGAVTMHGNGYRGGSMPDPIAQNPCMPTTDDGNGNTNVDEMYTVYGSNTGEGVGGEWNISLSTVGGVGGGGGGFDCGAGDIVPSTMPANGQGNIAPGTPLPADNVTYAYWGSGGSYATQGNSTCSGAGSTYGDAHLGSVFMGGGSGSISQSAAHSCDVNRHCCRVAAGAEAGQCVNSSTDTNACTDTPYCDAHVYPWNAAFAGQPGGGIIFITAGQLTLSGQGVIDASGVSSTAGNFGSAGGSIYIRAGSLTLGGTGAVTAAGGNGGGGGRIRLDAAQVDMGFTPNWTVPPATFVQLAPNIAQSIVVLNAPMGYSQAIATVFPAGVSLPTMNGVLDPVASLSATGLYYSLSQDSGSTWDLVSPQAQAMWGSAGPAMGTNWKWQLAALGQAGSAHGVVARFTP